MTAKGQTLCLVCDRVHPELTWPRIVAAEGRNWLRVGLRRAVWVYVGTGDASSHWGPPAWLCELFPDPGPTDEQLTLLWKHIYRSYGLGNMINIGALPATGA